MESTAYGLGSTTCAAENFPAAAKPAPDDIPPWVMVGPSSTTSTFFPAIIPGSSADIAGSGLYDYGIRIERPNRVLHATDDRGIRGIHLVYDDDVVHGAD
jgi:hypothetical protein